MNTYIKKAAILLAVVLMAGGFMQKAYGVPIYEQYVVGGYTFLQPWKAVDPGLTWQQMEAAKPAGYDVASLAIVNAAMAAAVPSIAPDIYGAFVKLIGGTGNDKNPTGCDASKTYCDIFLADLGNITETHKALLDNNDGSYTTDIVQDNTNTIQDIPNLAGMLYVKQTVTEPSVPEPSLSLLLGGSLMGLGYLAYRRRRG